MNIVFPRRETLAAFSAKGWCAKCMCNTYLYQPKPKTDPLTVVCETCGQTQNAITTELSRGCIAEHNRIKAERKSKNKKG